MRRPDRRAFTLAEVLVAFALIAVLAAVIIPTMRGRLQESYEDALVSELDNLSSAVTAYRQDVGHYPPRISYLYKLPASPKDRCGNLLRDSAFWRGPYVNRYMQRQTFYYVAQKDSVMDSLFTFSKSGTVGIDVQINGPDSLTARDLDLKIDGADNGGVGGLQYSAAAGSGDYQIYYIIPTKTGAC